MSPPPPPQIYSLTIPTVTHYCNNKECKIPKLASGRLYLTMMMMMLMIPCESISSHVKQFTPWMEGQTGKKRTTTMVSHKWSLISVHSWNQTRLRTIITLPQCLCEPAGLTDISTACSKHITTVVVHMSINVLYKHLPLSHMYTTLIPALNVWLFVHYTHHDNNSQTNNVTMKSSLFFRRWRRRQWRRLTQPLPQATASASS